MSGAQAGNRSARCDVAWSGVQVAMDVLFWIDIGLTFRTGFIDARQVSPERAYISSSADCALSILRCVHW
jgi:hypothetical protein